MRYSFTVGGHLEGPSAIPKCVPEWPWLPPSSPPRPSNPEFVSGSLHDFDNDMIDVQLECMWLTDPRVQGIPVKLHRKGTKIQVPYEFIQADNNAMVTAKDRGKIRKFALDTLQWMIPTEIGQIVVCVKGDQIGQIYYILDYTESGRECIARKYPKDNSNERITIPIHTVAQIWKR